jgi:hypothetical protein
VLLLLVVAVAPAAHAGDGVVEINQARALAGVVTPGDAPGFPVTLSAPGSYRLTSDLDVRVAPAPLSTSAIHVTSGDVAIDLAGFSVRGATLCGGTPLVCLPLGVTPLVLVDAVERFDLHGGAIRNGGSGLYSDAAETRVRDVSVSEMVLVGVGIQGIGARLERVRAQLCGDDGANLAEGEVVDSSFQRNGNDGLSVSGTAHVARTTASRNAAVGIAIGGGQVLDSAADVNAQGGIQGGTAAVLLRGNTARGNQLKGVSVAGPGSLVEGNVVQGTQGEGIVIGAAGVLVTNNVVQGSTNHGMLAPFATSVGGNSFTGNNGVAEGQNATPSLVPLAPSTCGSDTICP